jgi:hypothetical protein
VPCPYENRELRFIQSLKPVFIGCIDLFPGMTILSDSVPLSWRMMESGIMVVGEISVEIILSPEVIEFTTFIPEITYKVSIFPIQKGRVLFDNEKLGRI